MTRRDVADGAGVATAVVVAVLGCLFVVKPALDEIGDVWDRDPFKPRVVREQTRKHIEKTGEEASTQSETTVSVKQADDSVLERSLGDAGLLTMRIAVVFGAAFLSGALVQRAAVSFS